MSMVESTISHLTQQVLSEKDKAILVRLEGWLSAAKFEKIKENCEICIDKELNEKWALLREMDLIKKFTHPLHQIIRIPALSPSVIIDPKGPPTAKDPTSIIPMRILKGSPTVAGQDTMREKQVLPLVFGWTTYIMEEVEVVPALDILIVTSQPLRTG